MRKQLVAGIGVLLVVGLLVACGGTADSNVPAEEAVLVVKGQVSKELSLSMDGLKALGVETLNIEHPKNGPQDYEGVRLSAILDEAGVQSGASTLVLTASDDYSAEVPLADAQACADCLVSIGDDGILSMAMAGMSSKVWVKDVVSIEVK